MPTRLCATIGAAERRRATHVFIFNLSMNDRSPAVELRIPHDGTTAALGKEIGRATGDGREYIVSWNDKLQSLSSLRDDRGVLAEASQLDESIRCMPRDVVVRVRDATLDPPYLHWVGVRTSDTVDRILDKLLSDKVMNGRREDYRMVLRPNCAPGFSGGGHYKFIEWGTVVAHVDCAEGPAERHIWEAVPTNVRLTVKLTSASETEHEMLIPTDTLCKHVLSTVRGRLAAQGDLQRAAVDAVAGSDEAPLVLLRVAADGRRSVWSGRAASSSDTTLIDAIEALGTTSMMLVMDGTTGATA